MRLDAGRRIRAQAPFLLVLAILLAAVLYLVAEPGHWRRGTGVISVSMLVAALLRLVLPRASIGMLAVRSRGWDAICYALLGVAILVVCIRLRH